MGDGADQYDLTDICDGCGEMFVDCGCHEVCDHCGCHWTRGLCDCDLED